MMRRYTLNIRDREFTVDVQETDSDIFAVVVGNERYEVRLTGDESLSDGPAPAATMAPAPRPAAAPATPAHRAAGGSGKGTQTAPMPGVILEINVKPGDTVARGQQVAILDAMKMHNVIGADQSGVVAEIHMTAGQAVDHGAPLLTFGEE